MEDVVHPVILAGGSGTRLWPISRKSFPKQFSQIFDKKSLFQASACRFTGPNFAAPVIVTGNDFRFIVTEQLATCDINPQAMLIEPDGRNTGPAALAAAFFLAQKDANALMLVVPSDHVITNSDAFCDAIFLASACALDGKIVAFGIKPTRPETGYGYLELSTTIDQLTNIPQDLLGFIEKPDHTRAAELLTTGSYLWNAGIFLCTAQVFIDAFRSHAKDVLNPVEASVLNAQNDLCFTRLSPIHWDKVPNISIDYGIMERAKNIAVMPYAGSWSDLGEWNAVWQESGPDQEGNVTSPHSTAINCVGTLLHSNNSRVELVGVGLEDIIAVATDDAVLVAHRSQVQRVTEAVEVLKKRGAVQATQFPTDHRPWGWFERLIVGDRFQVKRIHVHPGAALSLQSHHHRSEHWIVVKGTARVVIDDEVKLVTENQSVYIPLGAIHRLENPGKVPMILIEVQTGSYLGEDDIIRYEDLYTRDDDFNKCG